MKFGYQVHNTVSWQEMLAAAQTADRLNWNSFWNFDHLVPPLGAVMPQLAHPRGEAGEVLESWSLLAALAAVTRRVRLGCLVTANTFRNPALLAKMAVTIDVISQGRFELGLGAAWHEREHRAYGLPFPDTRERLDRLDEAAQVIRLLFDATDTATFEGQYYKLDAAPFSPRSIQHPRVPLLIGGGGEKRTLRTVARWADTTNLMGNFMGTREGAQRKLQILDDHCAAVGRDPKEIRRTVGALAVLVEDDARAARLREILGQGMPDEVRRRLPLGNAQRLVDELSSLVSLGVDEIIILGPHSLGQPLELLLEGESPVEYMERFHRDVLSVFSLPSR